MKRNIDRILFIFKNEEEEIIEYDNLFFGLSLLLRTLITKNYQGPNIKFVNLYFCTLEYYNLYPKIPSNTDYFTRFDGGLLEYYAILDLVQFKKLSLDSQKKLIWEKACDAVLVSSSQIKNALLLQSCIQAKGDGLKINLNTDYNKISEILTYNGLLYTFCILYKFIGYGAKVFLTISQNEKFIKEIELDTTAKNYEFFFEMFKKIEFSDNNIIIKGHKDVEYLPKKILISELI